LAPVAYDPRLRFDVIVDTDVPPRHMDLATSSDGIVLFDCIGCAHLPGYGDLICGGWLYGGGVFVGGRTPVRGATTAGPVPDRHGQRRRSRRHDGLLIPTNLAYNPSCAYDPAWACSVAPQATPSAARSGGELAA
jgi:hypothetical protein